MRRRPVPSPSSLTSLVDVLFILVFAALVQRVGASSVTREPAAAPAPVTPPARPAWRPPPANEQLRQAAISQLAEALQDQPAIIARVSARGVLTSLELAGGSAGGSAGGGAAARPEATRVAVEQPLLERVDDPDIAIGYLGDRDEQQRICSLIAARALDGAALQRSLVVIAVDAPLADLMVALVSGLRRDVEHCGRAYRAGAVLLDPTSIDPTSIDPTSIDPTSTEPTEPAAGAASPPGDRTLSRPGERAPYSTPTQEELR